MKSELLYNIDILLININKDYWEKLIKYVNFIEMNINYILFSSFTDNCIFKFILVLINVKEMKEYKISIYLSDDNEKDINEKLLDLSQLSENLNKELPLQYNLERRSGIVVGYNNILFRYSLGELIYKHKTKFIELYSPSAYINIIELGLYDDAFTNFLRCILLYSAFTKITECPLDITLPYCTPYRDNFLTIIIDDFNMNIGKEFIVEDTSVINHVRLPSQSTSYMSSVLYMPIKEYNFYVNYWLLILLSSSVIVIIVIIIIFCKDRKYIILYI